MPQTSNATGTSNKRCGNAIRTRSEHNETKEANTKQHPSIISCDWSCFGGAGIDSFFWSSRETALRRRSRVSSAVFGASRGISRFGVLSYYWEDRASHRCPEAKIPYTAAQQEQSLVPSSLVEVELEPSKGHATGGPGSDQEGHHFSAKRLKRQSGRARRSRDGVL